MGILQRLAGGSAKPQKREQPAKPASAPSKSVNTPSKPVKRDSRGRLVAGAANLNPGGRPKGREAELREMLERAGGDALLEGIIAGQVIELDGSVTPVRDMRLRVESYRWAYERANGKALERTQNVNLDLAGGEAALPLDRLPEGLLGALLEVSQGVLPPQGALPEVPAGVLPEGVVEGELVPEDLPGTDLNETK